MKQPREPLELLKEMNGYVERAQRTLSEYLPPDSGISAKDAVSNVLNELDNNKLLKVQEEARQLVRKRPAFFTSE